MKMRPRIGVTVDHSPSTDERSFSRGRALYYLNENYVEMVERSGAVPYLLPATDNHQLIGEMLDPLHGILLTGGSDVDPSAYGEEAAEETHEFDRRRTFFEIALIKEALKRNIPIFGICRGNQSLNVALGGDLYQHVPRQLEGAIKHRAGKGEPVARHEIEIEPDSKLAQILGKTRLEVNSYHHQAVRKVGQGLRVVARSVADGVVEALELPEKTFCLSVQWHPERDFERPEEQKLLAAFVEAAATYARRRESQTNTQT